MALRENECFLVRRVVARGIDKNIGGSRVGGKDRFSICRVADRGSNGVYPDHRDLKINRLHKQVQDLEVSSTWKETELEEPIGDELIGDEEHPTNGDIIYDSPLVFDEYGDEKWYFWATGGVVERYEEQEPYIISSCMFDSYYKHAMMFVGIFTESLKDHVLAYGGEAVYSGNVEVAGGGEIPMPTITGGSIDQDIEPIHLNDKRGDGTLKSGGLDVADHMELQAFGRLNLLDDFNDVSRIVRHFGAFNPLRNWARNTYYEELNVGPIFSIKCDAGNGQLKEDSNIFIKLPISTYAYNKRGQWSILLSNAPFDSGGTGSESRKTG